MVLQLSKGAILEEVQRNLVKVTAEANRIRNEKSGQ